MAHPNEELLHRYFKAVDNRDLDTLDELFADDIVAHIAGNHTLAGDYRGKNAVFGFFGQLAERSGGTARLHPRNALADDWSPWPSWTPPGRWASTPSTANPGLWFYASKTAGSSSSGATTTTKPGWTASGRRRGPMATPNDWLARETSRIPPSWTNSPRIGVMETKATCRPVPPSPRCAGPTGALVPLPVQRRRSLASEQYWQRPQI